MLGESWYDGRGRECDIGGGGGSDGPTHVMVTRLLNLHEIVSDEG